MSGTPAWAEARTAIVTGGAAGIGSAISRRLAADGAAVAIFDRDGEAAAAAAKEIEGDGGRALGVAVDVSDRSQVDAGVAEVREALGPATILVNNAGIAPFAKFLEITREELEAVIRVNLIGTFECCQAVVPDMVEAHWGRIVNIASSSAQTGSPMQVHYSATKGGVIAMSYSLAQALGPKGITVNVVPPSLIVTPGLREAEDLGMLGEGAEVHARSLPVRRPGQPEDIAAAVAFLARDDAGYVTGQVLGVNGGRVMG